MDRSGDGSSTATSDRPVASHSCHRPVSHEARPADADYYETRLELFSQGDIFRDVPLAYPMPAGELLESDTSAGTRRFLSGPFDVGFGMLVTPTCSMRAQGAPHEYAHPVRTLVPIRPIDDDLQRQLGLDAAKLGLVRKYDRLINYMYLPVEEELGATREPCVPLYARDAAPRLHRRTARHPARDRRRSPAPPSARVVHDGPARKQTHLRSADGLTNY